METRVNFGLDKDNKLKLGGGTVEETSEIILDNTILQTLFSKGIYLTKIENGKLIIFNDKETIEIDINGKAK